MEDEEQPIYDFPDEDEEAMPLNQIQPIANNPAEPNVRDLPQRPRPLRAPENVFPPADNQPNDRRGNP